MPVVSVPKDFRCSITTGIFRVPVFTADGFTYERSAIERHFSDGNDKSPLTNEPLRNRNLVPNNNLKSHIESFRETVLSANKFKTAIETGDLKTLKSSSFLPLDEYKDINPLFLAVETGQLNVLQYLLKECGENPTTLKDDAGNTLLHRAGNSSPKMVRYLVRDCKLKLEEKNRAGRTPLLQILTDRAARRSHSVIKELLELGADPKFSIDNANVLIAGVIGLPLAKMLVMKGAGVPAVVEQFFADGSSILHRHWSHTQKAVKVFEYFFSLIPTEARRIAIVRRIRNDGQTLLHASVRNPEILKILLGTPYSLSVAAVDKNGRNALHQWAMRAEHSDASEETLRLLLAAGIDINAKTPAGKTALHFAKADMRRFHQLMAAGASSNDVFDSLTVANLRLLYHRSIGLIKEGNRTNPNETYVGKKVEAFNNSENCWMPAEIVEMDEKLTKIKIHFERTKEKYDKWLDVEAQKLEIRRRTVNVASSGSLASAAASVHPPTSAFVPPPIAASSVAPPLPVAATSIVPPPSGAVVSIIRAPAVIGHSVAAASNVSSPFSVSDSIDSANAGRSINPHFMFPSTTMPNYGTGWASRMNQATFRGWATTAASGSASSVAAAASSLWPAAASGSAASVVSPASAPSVVSPASAHSVMALASAPSVVSPASAPSVVAPASAPSVLAPASAPSIMAVSSSAPSNSPTLAEGSKPIATNKRAADTASDARRKSKRVTIRASSAAAAAAGSATSGDVSLSEESDT